MSASIRLLLLTTNKLGDVLASLSSSLSTRESILDKLHIFGKVLDVISDVAEGVSSVGCLF